MVIFGEKIIEILKKRRSVRFFDSSFKVSDKQIKLILESARWVPSARNLQPLEFIQVTDPNIKSKLNKICRQNAPELASVLIALVGNISIVNKIGKISTHDVTTESKGRCMFLYLDAGAAIQNMLLTATSLDLDSLWISSFDEKGFYKVFNLPENYVPLAIVCIGKQKMSPFSPSKRSIKERLHMNIFEEKDADLSYLEECKIINEEFGELKRYK